jgi:hypothetical protein
MKKQFLLLSTVALLASTSCGPSEAEKQKAINDITSALNEIKAEPVPETPVVEKVDYNSTPEKVIETIANAAKTSVYEPLQQLCNDAIKTDRDTKRLCSLATDKKGADEFNQTFASLKTDGVPEITGDNAKVNVTFGPDGKLKETMKMVKVDNKWFLEGF